MKTTRYILQSYSEDPPRYHTGRGWFTPPNWQDLSNGDGTLKTARKLARKWDGSGWAKRRFTRIVKETVERRIVK